MKNILLGNFAFLGLLPKVALESSQILISQPACQQGSPECLALVIEAMAQRYQELADLCDHNALFSLAYLRTTEKFQDTLNTIGYSDRASIVREDALFADYYFQAYEAYKSNQGNVPPAWQIAFDAAKNGTVSGAGDLFLGFNAHIQRDLPFVLYELDLQGHPVSHEDHTLVNQFLQQVSFLDEAAQRFDPTIKDLDLPGDQDDQQRFQQIVQWRELAFQNYQKLRNASSDEERAQVAAEIEGYSAATATGIQQLFSYPPGTDSSARDAYCQECSHTNSL